jgi:hypothetical protein
MMKAMAKMRAVIDASTDPLMDGLAYMAVSAARSLFGPERAKLAAMSAATNFKWIKEVPPKQRIDGQPTFGGLAVLLDPDVRPGRVEIRDSSGMVLAVLNLGERE